MIDPYTFPHRVSGDCASGILRDLLEYHGASWTAAAPTEAIVFGVGAGMHFHFSEESPRDAWPEVAPPLLVLGRALDVEEQFAAHAGLDLRVERPSDAGEAWGRLRDRVQRGEPTIVWADIRDVDYLDVQLHNARHDVLVLAVEPEGDAVIVVDHATARPQRCSTAALARARASRAYPTPSGHTAFTLRPPVELAPLQEAVRAGARRTVALMRNGEGATVGPGVVTGLAGVRAFAASFPTWPERFADGLEGALKRVRVFIRNAGTDGAIYRRLQSEFLADAGRELGDARLGAAAQVYAELAEAWRTLAAALRERDPRAAHAEACAALPAVERLEHRGIEELEQWLARSDPFE